MPNRKRQQTHAAKNALPQNAFSVERLETAYWIACENWRIWRADFEFTGHAGNLPILSKPERHKAFLAEYNPLRGIAGKGEGSEGDLLYKQLCKPGVFQRMINHSNGAGIDTLNEELANHLLISKSKLSYLSKLATFSRPETFLPWDSFARKGVAKLNNGPAQGNYKKYVDFLSSANRVWDDHACNAIETFLNGRSISASNGHREGFSRRMLDVCLMLEGGRWKHSR